jgi:hypothetical protein
MSADVRDGSVGEWLDGAVRNLAPDPERRLPETLRKGTLRRTARWTAIGTGLALFVASIGWTALVLGGNGQSSPAGPPAWRSYTNAEGGFAIRYPSEWKVLPYRAMCMRWTGPGVWVSNVRYGFRNQPIKDGCTNQWVLSGIPEDVVAVDVQPAVIGPPGLGSSPPPDTPFPLSLTTATPLAGPTPGPAGRSMRTFSIPIVRGGQHLYDVMIWFGPKASPADRALSAQMVESIRFSAPATP